MNGETIRHVVATVGGKPFNLPLVVGKSRSNAGGHGRGPLRRNLEDCKLIIDSASDVNASLKYLREYAAKKTFRLEFQEGKAEQGFGHRSFNMRIDKTALLIPLFNGRKDVSSASETQRFVIRSEDSTEMRYCAFAHTSNTGDAPFVFAARVIVFSEARAYNKVKRAQRKQQQESAKPGAKNMAKKLAPRPAYPQCSQDSVPHRVRPHVAACCIWRS